MRWGEIIGQRLPPMIIEAPKRSGANSPEALKNVILHF
jgi:hypothetical protein